MAKKLIEVALPLEDINKEAAREKSIRHGHPSTLHLWWARRPLAAARAVLFAQLVDDPSAHPELFPTQQDQDKERERLFNIIRKLVVWENSNDPKVLKKAKAEIVKSIGSEPVDFLDPFAGGGAIPLEAQRLGLRAHAGDLNPVAVMINKAMIEIPPKFAGCAPVNPDRSNIQTKWIGSQGLAEDIAYYGQRMKEEAFKRVGHLYPQVDLPKEYGGGKATVIAWIWARTVKCSNPACGCEMPLVRSFDLSTKKGNEAHVEVEFENGKGVYSVKRGKATLTGTIDRRGAVCPCCGAPLDFSYIRSEGKSNRMGQVLMAVVAEGKNGRIYLNPNKSQTDAAFTNKPSVGPDEKMVGKAAEISLYGLSNFSDLFSNRQLTTLTTFVDVLKDLRQEIEADAIHAGMADDGKELADGGSAAKAYAEAVSVYLSFAVDKITDYNSLVCSWLSARETLRSTFGRQAISMAWDFAEANPFSNSSGCFDNMLEWIYKCVKEFGSGVDGMAEQIDAAQDNGLRNIVISSDPPYYDNICYADLSDFFYVWLRMSLKKIYPYLFKTMLVPKTEELVASPFRFDNKKEAKQFFEDGMLQTFRQINKYTRDDVPVTIYYAFKQSETEDSGSAQEKTASSGWETMLSAIIKAGFAVTGTWPMRTEREGRMIGIGTNALASSIVLVCRKRNKDASVCTRQDFVKALRRELKTALQKLQSSNLAPVDLAQSAIGPGIAVYSRYGQVLESDGAEMTVREALQIINQELDAYFTEQDGDLQPDSRFCVSLYEQFAFNDVRFGEAQVLAQAKNVSIDVLAQKFMLTAKGGIVHLLTRDEIPHDVSIETPLWLLTQILTHAMETGGIQACAKIVSDRRVSSDAENAKALAYRLFTIADRKGWTQEAYAYNTLVNAWPAIQEQARELSKAGYKSTGDLFN